MIDDHRGPTPAVLLPEVVAGLSRRLVTCGTHLVAAYLFGSVARSESGPLSDLDVALLFDGPSLDADARLAAAARCQTILATESSLPVQVSVLNEASPSFVHRVLRDGVILVGADDPRRVSFEARALAEYLDFQPLMDRFDRALMARAREGRLGT